MPVKGEEPQSSLHKPTKVPVSDYNASFLQALVIFLVFLETNLKTAGWLVSLKGSLSLPSEYFASLGF